MSEFQLLTRMPVSGSELFAWHARAGAFERLIPPFKRVEVIEREGGMADGGRIVMRVREGPMWMRWVARIRDVVPGERFVDAQEEGPFAYWRHTHRFESAGAAESVLDDHVAYRAPFGCLGALLGRVKLEPDLRRLFAWRHARTRLDLARHARFADRPRLRVLIGGASGLVGTALRHFLSTGGHEVWTLERGRARAGANEIAWEPNAGKLDAGALAGFNAVILLSGANIAGARWTPAYKQILRDSRVNSAQLLASRLAECADGPRVLLCASAVGYYGARGDEELTETSAAGEGFMSELCHEWEAAADPARAAGARVAHLRIGVVMTPLGGALAKMLPAFRWGVAGVLGSGRQYLSWIALDDLVGMFHHALFDEQFEGAVNATAPTPVTNHMFTKTLGRVLRRPTILPAPGFAIRAVLGEMGDQLLLRGNRVLPERAAAGGFEFALPDLASALRWEMGDAAASGITAGGCN